MHQGIMAYAATCINCESLATSKRDVAVGVVR
jgi:hypothetical protein